MPHYVLCYATMYIAIWATLMSLCVAIFATLCYIMLQYASISSTLVGIFKGRWGSWQWAIWWLNPLGLPAHLSADMSCTISQYGVRAQIQMQRQIQRQIQTQIQIAQSRNTDLVAQPSWLAQPLLKSNVFVSGFLFVFVFVSILYLSSSLPLPSRDSSVQSNETIWYLFPCSI